MLLEEVLVELGLVGVEGGGDDEAIGAAAEQHVDLAALARGVAGGVADDERVAVHLDGLLEAGGNFGEKGVRDLRNDDADNVRFARDEAARPAVRTVIELTGAVLNALAGLVLDVRMAVEGAETVIADRPSLRRCLGSSPCAGVVRLWP